MTIMTRDFRDLYWNVLSPEARQGCILADIRPRLEDEKIVYDLGGTYMLAGLDWSELVEELEEIGREIFEECKIREEIRND